MPMACGILTSSLILVTAQESAAYNLKFEGVGGTLVNIPGFGSPQAKESGARAADSFDANYSLAADSWFDDGISKDPNNPAGPGTALPNGLSLQLVAPVEGPNSMSGGFGADAAAGQTFSSGRIAHLILNVDSNPSAGSAFGVMVTGSLARGGVDIPVSVLLTPEPVSSVLGGLVMAMACMVRRRAC